MKFTDLLKNSTLNDDNSTQNVNCFSLDDNNELDRLIQTRDKLAAKIQKFGFTELQPELDNLNAEIAGVVKCDTPPIIKKFNTYFGEVTWNQDTGKIICRDCEFTESEILAVSNAGLSLSEMDFELKKHFPDAQLSVLPREEAA